MWSRRVLYPALITLLAVCWTSQPSSAFPFFGSRELHGITLPTTDGSTVVVAFLKDAQMTKAHRAERDSLARVIRLRLGFPVKLVMLAIANDSSSVGPIVIDDRYAYSICVGAHSRGNLDFCVQEIYALGVDEPVVVFPRNAATGHSGLGYTYIVFRDIKITKTDKYQIMKKADPSGSPDGGTAYNPGCCGRGGP